MKNHHQIWIVLAIGSVVLLVYMMRKNSPSAAGAAVSSPDTASPAAPSYPNSQPLSLPDTSSQLAPLNLTYNQPDDGMGNIPTVRVSNPNSATGGGGCGCDDDCIAAGNFVTVNNVPAPVLAAAASNLSAFQGKFYGMAGLPAVAR